ncbi:MAG: SRPBCC family protein [Alphaproteobacteria bacterium]|nr:SRPBCC family protein [Alphaproteobacteria bacterium]
MKHYETIVEFDAPIDEVFQYVDSPEYIKLWMEGLEGIEYIGTYDPENPIGTEFRMWVKEGRQVNEYKGEVLDYRQGEYLEVSNYSDSFFMRVRYAFRPLEGNRTAMTYTLGIEMKSRVAKVMGFLFGWFTRMLVGKFMKNLRAAVAEKRTPA